jgi:hypothetical protein
VLQELIGRAAHRIWQAAVIIKMNTTLQLTNYDYKYHHRNSSQDEHHLQQKHTHKIMTVFLVMTSCNMIGC